MDPKEDPIINFGVSCDLCCISNFRSPRYKCRDCENFDLCLECYTKHSSMPSTIHGHSHERFFLIESRYHPFLLGDVDKILKVLEGKENIVTSKYRQELCKLLGDVVLKNIDLYGKSSFFDYSCYELISRECEIEGDFNKCFDVFTFAESVLYSMQGMEYLKVDLRIRQGNLHRLICQFANMHPTDKSLHEVSAKSCYEEALKTADENNLPYQIYRSRRALFLFYKALSMEVALEHLEKAYDAAKRLDDQSTPRGRHETEVAIDFCEVYKQGGDMNLAKKWCSTILQSLEGEKEKLSPFWSLKYVDYMVLKISIEIAPGNKQQANLSGTTIAKMVSSLEWGVEVLKNITGVASNELKASAIRLCDVLGSLLTIGVWNAEDDGAGFLPPERTVSEVVKLARELLESGKTGAVQSKLTQICDISKKLDSLEQESERHILSQALKFFTKMRFHVFLTIKGVASVKAAISEVFSESASLLASAQKKSEFVESFFTFYSEYKKKLDAPVSHLQVTENLLIVHVDEIAMVELLRVRSASEVKKCTMEINKMFQDETREDDFNFVVGELSLKKGDYDNAMKYLQLAADEKNTRKSVVWFLQGRVWMLKFEFAHAKFCFTKALKTMGKSKRNQLFQIEILLELGMLLFLTKEYKKSLAYCEKAQSLLPNVTGGKKKGKRPEDQKLVYGKVMLMLGILHTKIILDEVKSFRYLNNAKLSFTTTLKKKQNTQFRNLIIVNLFFSDAYFKKGNVHKSIDYLNRTVNHLKKLNNTKFLKEYIALKKAEFYKELNEVDTSLKTLERLAHTVDVNQWTLSRLLVLQGALYEKLKKQEMAVDYTLRGVHTHKANLLKLKKRTAKNDNIFALAFTTLAKSHSMSLDFRRSLLKCMQLKICVKKRKGVSSTLQESVFDSFIFQIIAHYHFINGEYRKALEHVKYSLLLIPDEFSSSNKLSLSITGHCTKGTIFSKFSVNAEAAKESFEKCLFLIEKATQEFDRFRYFFIKRDFIAVVELCILYFHSRKQFDKYARLMETIKTVEVILRIRTKPFQTKLIKSLGKFNTKQYNMCKGVHYYCFKSCKKLLVVVSSTMRTNCILVDDFDAKKVDYLVMRIAELNLRMKNLKYKVKRKDYGSSPLSKKKLTEMNEVKVESKKIAIALFKCLLVFKEGNVYHDIKKAISRPSDVVRIFPHGNLDQVPFSAIFVEETKKYLLEEVNFQFVNSICVFSALESQLRGIEEYKSKKRKVLNDYLLMGNKSEDDPTSSLERIGDLVEKPNRMQVLTTSRFSLGEVQRSFKKHCHRVVYLESNFNVKKVPALDPLNVSVFLEMPKATNVVIIEESVNLKGVELFFLNGGCKYSYLGLRRIAEAFSSKGVNSFVCSLFDLPESVRFWLSHKFFHLYVQRGKSIAQSLREASLALMRIGANKDFPFLFGTTQCFGYSTNY